MKAKKRKTITGVKTRTTRYCGKDGKERAVLFWDDYEFLLLLTTDKIPRIIT